jgi:hypothetical protein
LKCKVNEAAVNEDDNSFFLIIFYMIFNEGSRHFFQKVIARVDIRLKLTLRVINIMSELKHKVRFN